MGKANKVEERMGVLTKGFESIAKTERHKVRELHEELKTADFKIDMFHKLRVREGRAIPQRVQRWQDLLGKEKEHESVLQSRFERLMTAFSERA